MFRNSFHYSFHGNRTMKLDAFIKSLLPKDDKFFNLFDQLATIMVESAGMLKTLPALPMKERAATVEMIEELENKADSVTHAIFTHLHTTFVTPIDREDIHSLASKMDDVVDFIHGSSKRFYMYKIKKDNKHIQKLTEIIYEATLHIQSGVSLIRNISDEVNIKTVLLKIHQCENDGDDTFNEAIAYLFEKEKNPIDLIKAKEVLVTLETATDNCEDVANILEAILIKNN